MEIRYISGDAIVLEASENELRKIKGDSKYTPHVGDKINVDSAWNNYMRIKSQKSRMTALRNELAFLEDKI